MRGKKQRQGDAWTVAEARARLPELIDATAQGPQRVFRRDRPAAVVVSPDLFDELSALKAERSARSIEDAFAELREMGETLDVPERRDRAQAYRPEGDGKRRTSR